MYGQVHANRVFYKNAPAPGHRFKQITLHELDRFILMMGEGEVIRDVPFEANNPDMQAVFFNNLRDATAGFEDECQTAEQEGWIPHEPGM